VVNVIDRIECGECDISVTEYRGPNSKGRPHDVYKQELVDELLRLAKLGAAAEKAMGDCRTPKELQLNCSFCDRCAIYDVCKLRKE
jgi:hypothetical protein